MINCDKYIKMINPKTMLNFICYKLTITMLKFTADKTVKCRKLKEKLNAEK